jgi:hypothetical protein
MGQLPWYRVECQLEEVTMTIELTDPLRQAVHAHPDEPIRMVDPGTHAEYVLIRAELFERMEQLVGIDPRVSYPLIDESFREGWDEPKMAEYDNYEARKKT